MEAIQRQASLLLEEDGADALPKLLELIDTGEWLARCFYIYLFEFSFRVGGKVGWVRDA